MRSLLKEIESKFIEIEDSLDAPENETPVKEEELDEMSATGGVAGYNIPAAFAKPGKWRNKSKTYESVNKPANWTMGAYQKPEDVEEEYTDKFPFAEDEKIWQHKNYKYPSVDLRDTPGLSKRKDKTKNIK